ncbi:MAG: xanthine dehydrogenase family protein subunit M [Candidatus Protistobacter heckmanni]|nr:xanthine dehydrogenase family protein subunit M [Candidatus Protistobacter heckmanni]
MYPLIYLRPSSIDEAVRLLREHEEARPLSGGMTLIPTLKLRLAAPTHLVDLSRIEALRGIRFENGVLRIGAATRHIEVAQSATVRKALPALAALAAQIADPQVRHRDAMGGSVANNDPAADYPAAVLGLDGTVLTDRRRIAAEDFFLGTFEVALEPDELVTALEFRPPLAAHYEKFRHPASGYALAGVFAARLESGARVAVTGAGPSVFRWREAEAALDARPGAHLDPAALDGLFPDADAMAGDIHASAAYRANLVHITAVRALAALAKQET